MSEDIEEAIRELRRMNEQRHVELADRLFATFHREICSLDFLAGAVLNRSVSLTSGFCTLTEARNFLAAFPLVRLQLDSALRLSAAWLVTDPHAFADAVLQGTSVRKLQDRDGNFMHDGYLANKLNARHPGLKNAYEATSGYIHLSNHHILNAVNAQENPLVFAITINEQNSYVPDTVYLEAIGLFKDVSEIAFDYIRSWCYSKEHQKAP